MSKIISLTNLCKSYVTGEFIVRVLNDVTLDIYENDIVFIVGPSGAGKTTLLNILGLMDDFDSGTYTLMGENVQTMDRTYKNHFIREYIGFLFQNVPLLKELNVYENIMLPSKIKNSAKIAPSSVIEICQKLGIQELLNRKITQISSGQRQRVGLASILIKQPKIIFCDEPTANLDNESTQKMMELLKDINRIYGIVVVFATHNISLSHFANKIYKISYGRVEGV